jgi:hypothetical protein
LEQSSFQPRLIGQGLGEPAVAATSLQQIFLRSDPSLFIKLVTFYEHWNICSSRLLYTGRKSQPAAAIAVNSCQLSAHDPVEHKFRCLALAHGGLGGAAILRHLILRKRKIAPAMQSNKTRCLLSFPFGIKKLGCTLAATAIHKKSPATAAGRFCVIWPALPVPGDARLDAPILNQKEHVGLF